MTSEHNGGDRVTWRDLREAIRDYAAELDRRFIEHGRQHESERKSDQEALRLARESLEKALARTNEFREEATQDKQKYAEINFVNSENAKLESAVRSELSAVRTSLSGLSSDIRTLQNSNNVMRGKDLGLLGLVASLGGAVAYVIVNLIGK